MEKQSLRQSDLAGIIGLPQYRVSKWKKGNIHPQADNAVKIASVLNTSVKYLVTGKEPGMSFLSKKKID